MIRFANINDVDDIMDFIQTHWKAGHILARDKDFFLYEFQDLDDPQKINMVISRDEKTDSVQGFLGFYPLGKTSEKNDITFGIYKAIKTNKTAMLGISILQYFIKNSNAKNLFCPGSNPNTSIKIMDSLKFKTGIMSHWYRLNPNIKDFKIAQIKEPKIPSVETKAKLIKFDNFKNLKANFDFEKYYKSGAKPTKEDWYIKWRYFEHPIYKYDVFGVENEGQVETLLVFRIQELDNSKCLRFVDVIGNFENLYHATTAIDELQKQLQTEYIDLYEYGLDAQKLKASGWLFTKDTKNIIPNYFSPFVRENIDIYFNTKDKECKIFKADSDQDRPS